MSEYEKRLNVLLAQVLREFEAIRIYPAGKILSISENSRAKKRLGCCRQVRGGINPSYRLEISTMLRGWDDDKLKEVIAHEVLHTCKGCMNHGAKWKALAGRAEEAYGYHITVSASPDRLGTEFESKTKYRYRIKCVGCGNTMYRMKKSKVIQNIGSYRCGKCGGALEVDRL